MTVIKIILHGLSNISKIILWLPDWHPLPKNSPGAALRNATSNHEAVRYATPCVAFFEATQSIAYRVYCPRGHLHAIRRVASGQWAFAQAVAYYFSGGTASGRQ